MIGRGFLGGVASGAEKFILNREAALAKLAAQKQKNEAERIKQERKDELEWAKSHEDRAKVGRVPSHILERKPPEFDEEIAEEEVVTTEGFMRVKPTSSSIKAAKRLGLTPTFIDTPQTKGALIEAFIPAETKSLPKKEDVPIYYNEAKNTLTSEGQNWLNRYNSLYPRRQMEEEQLVNAFKKIVTPATGKKDGPTTDSKASIGWVHLNEKTAKIELTSSGEKAYELLRDKWGDKSQFIKFLYDKKKVTRLKELSDITIDKNQQPSATHFPEFDPIFNIHIPKGTDAAPINFVKPSESPSSAIAYLTTLNAYAKIAKRLDENISPESKVWEKYFRDKIINNDHISKIKNSEQILTQGFGNADGDLVTYPNIFSEKEDSLAPDLYKIIRENLNKTVAEIQKDEPENVNGIRIDYGPKKLERTRLANLNPELKNMAEYNGVLMDSVINTPEYENFKKIIRGEIVYNTEGKALSDQEISVKLFEIVDKAVENHQGSKDHSNAIKQRAYSLIGMSVVGSIKHTETKRVGSKNVRKSFNKDYRLKEGKDTDRINRQFNQSTKTLDYVTRLGDHLDNADRLGLDLNMKVSNAWYTAVTIGKNLRGGLDFLRMTSQDDFNDSTLKSTRNRLSDEVSRMRENLQENNVSAEVLRNFEDIAKESDNKLSASVGNVKEAYQLKARIEFSKVQLAYQLAGLFQGGGSGSRTISDADYAIIMKALSGGTTDSLRESLHLLESKLRSDIVIAKFQAATGKHGIHNTVGKKLRDKFLTYVNWREEKRKIEKNLETAAKDNNNNNVFSKSAKIPLHLEAIDYTEQLTSDKLVKLNTVLENIQRGAKTIVDNEVKETAQHVLDSSEITEKTMQKYKDILYEKHKIPKDYKTFSEYMKKKGKILHEQFNSTKNTKKREKILTEISLLNNTAETHQWLRLDGEFVNAKQYKNFIQQTVNRIKRFPSHFKNNESE